MQTSDSLRGLGLKDKEMRVYTALLELGESSVSALSRKSAIKRSTVYLVLQSLEEKSFVVRMGRGKKTVFLPQHPQKLVAEAEFNLKELKATIPRLESLLQKGAGKPRVVIYEGKERLDQAYDEAFLEKGEVFYMSNFGLSLEVFPRTFKKITDYARLSPEFRMRELFDETGESRKYAERNRGPYHEIRFIPKEFLPFEIDIGVFGNTVLITSVKKEYFTVSIESGEIAKAFRALYEVMWRTAKE